MKWGPLFLLLLVVVGFSGCDDNPVGPTPIRDVTWKLEVIDRSGNPVATVPNPEQYTLRFEADGRLNVRADCNTCNGRYALVGSLLTIDTPMACTLAFCALASLDGSYVAALQSARTATVSNSNLVIQGPGVTLRFRN